MTSCVRAPKVQLYILRLLSLSVSVIEICSVLSTKQTSLVGKRSMPFADICGLLFFMYTAIPNTHIFTWQFATIIL